MAVTIIKDTTDNQEVTESTNGYQAVRRLILDGVTAASPEGIVYAAMTDSGLSAIGARLGNAHPVMTALFCYERVGKALDTNKVEITCTYSAFQSNVFPNNTQTPLLTISSFIQQAETTEDNTGTDMTVTYNGDSQTATANIDICLTNLVFSRLETTNPSVLQGFVDTLNASSITYRSVVYAAKTLKCTSINGVPKTDGGSYQVDYTLLYNPNGWEFDAAYLKDGVIPGDATSGNGFEVYDVYTTTNFSSLNLA